MDLTYREKRIWISLCVQSAVYVFYFVELHRNVVTIGWLPHIILLIIVLQVVLQIILRLTARPERKDERDIAIDRISYRNAYVALVTLVAGAMTMLAVHVFHFPHAHDPGFGPFHVVNALLLILILAEMVKLVSQLVLYRRTV